MKTLHCTSGLGKPRFESTEDQHSHARTALEGTVSLQSVCVCMCVRRRYVCEAESCVRRARHVIQRNPPPETRGSEGDSIGYKESTNICLEQCKADENISSELARDLNHFIWFPLDLFAGVGAPWETHLLFLFSIFYLFFIAIEANVTHLPKLLEITEDILG